MPCVESASRWVGDQVHERARGSFATDSLEQKREDGVAETLTLVLGEHGHVDNVEVPAPIAEQPPHGHGPVIDFVHDVYRRPASSERGPSLIFSLRGQTGASPQLEVVRHRGRPVRQAIRGRERDRVHDRSLHRPRLRWHPPA